MDEPTNGKEEETEGEDRSGFALRPESEKVIRELGHVFRLLSDESRLRILAYLMQEGELHVTDLCARLGQTQPAVSHHLALLRVAGVIEPRREGKHNYYRICIDRLGEMLIKLLSTSGSMPKKLRFHGFTLTHMGR
ncbi:MAG: winged helix-turn-helix transcriptional regulator [Planctomycetaceae bacterium]|nr:winged helix-turn-helix transcriptional regulator [Planctomycetaceae bacterium]